METKTAECINTHDQVQAAGQAGLPAVAVLARHSPGTREWYRDGWKVWRFGYNLGTTKYLFDPDYQCRVFQEDRELPWREARKKALAEAQAWASERYGIEKWARNRMGDYVDARVNRRFPLRSLK